MNTKQASKACKNRQPRARGMERKNTTTVAVVMAYKAWVFCWSWLFLMVHHFFLNATFLQSNLVLLDLTGSCSGFLTVKREFFYTTVCFQVLAGGHARRPSAKCLQRILKKMLYK